MGTKDNNTPFAAMCCLCGVWVNATKRSIDPELGACCKECGPFVRAADRFLETAGPVIMIEPPMPGEEDFNSDRNKNDRDYWNY